MKLLIIGGTSFIGRHITMEASKKGHTITLFNRGKSDPSAFPELRLIKGDRQKDAYKLAGEEWDAVIDTSAYTPGDLEPMLPYINTGHYTFVSTISVYDNFREGPVAEDGSTHTQIINSDEVNGKTYGPLKMMCENLLQDKMRDKLLIVRPCIVAGPHDPTDRFTDWALRLASNRPVIIPGSRRRKIQWIDVRDLAEFIINKVEEQSVGTYNVASDPLSMEAFVEALQTGEVEKIWVDDETLLRHGIKPFEIPFWMPVTEDYPDGFILVENSQSKKEGLRLTPLAQTGEETRKWFGGLSRRELKAGLDKQKENEILFNMRQKSE
ncbi:MAG TPA: NAD-dependent epimerase/dehydratase family protein [Planococcus sp. (in: firmicutes)]|nr:NAD-dependent epimerase/dehydratase family protein [Planococcus sp. (in: firmicutes)]